MNKSGVTLLVIAALIMGFTAIAHLSCIYFGPQCYSAQMAPPVIVESAKAKTLLAPLGTIFVSSIFLVLSAYALSGAGIVRKLPLLKLIVYGVGTLCIIRGILPIQLWLRHQEKVSEFVLVVGVAWLIVGLCFIVGFRATSTKRV